MSLSGLSPQYYSLRCCLNQFLGVILLTTWCLPAQAHFVLAYTPESNLQAAGDVPVKLLFWHPMTNGHLMPMDKPQSVKVFHRDQVIDLTDRLSGSVFTGLHNEASSWDMALPIKRSGDYVIAIEPVPYYEEAEDKYIQQLTKAYINRGQLPTNWDEPQNLPVEIIPLAKPYNIPVGTSFSGIVLSQGQPLPFAEIEVEFMVAEPNLKTNTVSSAAAISLPGGAMTIYSDATGKFTMTLNRAGYWGFAALDLIPGATYQDKPLSTDAVVWITAVPFQ